MPLLISLTWNTHGAITPRIAPKLHRQSPLLNNQLAFAIGDASGESLPAALMIANVQSSLRTAIVGKRQKVVAVTAQRAEVAGNEPRG
jgi:hypothetical protein